MRFVADSTIPQPSIEEIRALGNQVTVVDDSEADGLEYVFEIAADEERIVLTFEPSSRALATDADEVLRPVGVVCFQFDSRTSRDPANRLAAIFGTDGLELEGMFTLLEADRIRQTSL